MFNKKNFKDQYELYHQQEIQNHQNAILAYNMAMEKLRKEVYDLEKKLNIDITGLKNEISKLNRDNKFLFENTKKETEKNINKINDLQLELKKSEIDRKHLEKQIEKQQKEIDKIFVSVEENQNISKQNKKNIEHHTCTLPSELEKYFLKCLKEIQKLKIDIENTPSETLELKKEFDIKFSEKKLESESILKEINVYKNKAFINEKKIEYIITNIDRIKKRLSE